MDRIYMNRVPGSERIHIEIAASEVADLLDDLPTEEPTVERVKHSGPDTRFCVLCLSGNHDHATEEPTR
ncbi:hypothetical protein ACFV6Z_15495 [Streptomyces sp. NPDC059818]|uniref:hypothetical protein n=1 Tax=Streptomyces sp. NPDC059818 TaxID=3346962 RepID=UPI003657882A